MSTRWYQSLDKLPSWKVGFWVFSLIFSSLLQRYRRSLSQLCPRQILHSEKPFRLKRKMVNDRHWVVLGLAWWKWTSWDSHWEVNRTWPLSSELGVWDKPIHKSQLLQRKNQWTWMSWEPRAGRFEWWAVSRKGADKGNHDLESERPTNHRAGLPTSPVLAHRALGHDMLGKRELSLHTILKCTCSLLMSYLNLHYECNIFVTQS